MMQPTSNRTGRVVNMATGYQAFIPNSLPPNPPIQIDTEMQFLLSAADRKLGRLDGITRTLPNPNLFLAMFVKKEAVLSSQIEGTQASLVDILDVPSSHEKSSEKKGDVEAVVNYVAAMNHGLQRLRELPLSLRLIKEIHGILLQGVRGSERNPGEFRKSQNWIGPQGCSLINASFVPPPKDDMIDSMNDLEIFFHTEDFLPPLIKIAIIHAQFETIHPFLDGNGRIGRLLITFWLCHQDILSKPLLYLSYFFKLNRSEYYDRLMNVRMHGDWENWIKFFLKGIAVSSDEAISSAEQILGLKSRHTELLTSVAKNNNTYQKLLEYLFENPVLTRKDVIDHLNITSPTAGTLLESFCEIGILRDVTPDKQRGKTYYYEEYLDILERGI